MLKSNALLKLLVLMLLLSALTLWLISTAANASEIEYTGTGYFMTESAAIDILEGWTSDRAAKVAYKTALDSLYDEWQAFRSEMAAQIAEIKESHAQERREWQRALRRSKAPGFGVFAGAGYTTDGNVQGVIGFGLVWKIF